MTSDGTLMTSLIRYESEIQLAIGWLSRWSRRTALPIAWIAAMPMPLNGGGPHFKRFPNYKIDQSVCPVRDQRLPRALLAYNQAARAAAARHKVAYLDTWQQSLDLLELSFDMKHYARPVDLSVAEVLLHWHAAATRQENCGAAPRELP